MKRDALPWALVAMLLVSGFFYRDTLADARAESTRLRAEVQASEQARDSVSRWADSVLAARDSAMARERAEARQVIVRTAPVRQQAEAVLALPAPSTDTLRATIRALLWSNEQVTTAFLAHLASDSAWVAKTDSTWQAKVDAEVNVSDGLRALNANTEHRLSQAVRQGRREKLLYLGAGLLAGLLWPR